MCTKNLFNILQMRPFICFRRRDAKSFGQDVSLVEIPQDLISKYFENIKYSTVSYFERMSIRKRNEFLESDGSDEELDNGYDSDAIEESRGTIAGRGSKRRRLEHTSDEGPLNEIGEDESAETNGVERAEAGQTNGDYGQPGYDEDDTTRIVDDQMNTLKSSTPKQVAAAQKAARKSGVVYISRVPPFMKPQTLRHFLAPHAPKGIGRLFLTPEDHAAHTRRVKSGGNKKKSFTDGWVEFVSKKDAKIAVETLNGNIIGGKKGNFYHDDLWSMKYLKGFKWSHLTEQIANENAERAARMREEVRRTRQENKAFVEDVERGKMLEGMELKRKARGGGREGDGSSGRRRPEKEFKQKEAQKSRNAEEPSDQASRMQRMIF